MRNDSQAIALADFGALGRANEERGVYLLQSLLLDKDACQLRCAWLREAVRQVRVRFPNLGGRPRPDFLNRVLAAVTDPGIISAWRDGKVRFAELESLTRSPRALYEAHCRLLDIPPEPLDAGEDDLTVAPDELDPDILPSPPPVASLFAQGAPAAAILKHLQRGAEETLAELCEAVKTGWLRVEINQPRKTLGDLLRELNGCLSSVTVFEGWSPATIKARIHRAPDEETRQKAWEDRLSEFGHYVGPLLLSRLLEASCVGLAWGHTVEVAIEGVGRVCGSHPPRPGNPLNCVATTGGEVGQQTAEPRTSSSLLVRSLAQVINGDTKHAYTLHALEAYISYMDTGDEVRTRKKQISRYPHYQDIFGREGQPGLADQFDAIVTSCGNADQPNKFHVPELKRLGVGRKTLQRVTYGDIGGPFLPKAPFLSSHDKELFDAISLPWTGATLDHYWNCAQRKPGVILLAVGNNKAEVVLKCIELGLVTELLIDEDLARELWKKVDPEYRHHSKQGASPGSAVPMISELDQ